MKKRAYNSKKKPFPTPNTMAPTRVNTLNTPFLVIVESPSKCAKIEKFLGFQYKCIASKGHLRELKKVRSVKQKYTPEYDIIPEKKNHVVWMKTIVKQFDPKNIFVGTDDDREGEGIAWHICVLCDLDPVTTKRILFHEVTAPALKHAVSTPMTIRMNIVNAQQARQMLDRMIGFKISPVLSRMMVHDNSKYLSAGRCQTPTLRLVYDRHRAHLAHGQKESVQYRIQGHFFSHPSIWIGTLGKNMNSEKSVREFLEKSKNAEHLLDIREKKQKMSKPPKPFSTSHLLQTASSQLHMSPKYVMDGCQKLYQDGHITYMRTESMQYAEGFLTQCRAFIQQEYGESSIGDLGKIVQQDTQNPHEAIRVTHLTNCQTNYEDPKINDLYGLIWRRSVESCMTPYLYEEHGLVISAPESEYKGSIDWAVDLGWKRVTVTLEEMKKNQEKGAMDLHYYKRYLGKNIPFQKIEASLFMKDCEKYYQEAGLIQQLESLGIGRPSTYSMLVETVQERKYVLKENIEGEEFSGKEFTLGKNGMEVREVKKIFGASKNKLRIQPLGISAIEWLIEHCGPLFDYSYTSQMELELDAFLTEPDKEWHDVCHQCETLIKSCLKPLQDKMKMAYAIDEDHRLVFGKSGMMIQVGEGENKTYKSLKEDLELDFEKLENGEYTLEELLEVPRECLGIFQEKTVVMKKGPYGPYVVWGEDEKHSIGFLAKQTPLDKITLEDVIPILTKPKQEKQTGILRVIDKNTSVRNGKFGHYVFYKTDTMQKPSFINLKKCPHNVLEDEEAVIAKWVEETLTK